MRSGHSLHAQTCAFGCFRCIGAPFATPSVISRFEWTNTKRPSEFFLNPHRPTSATGAPYTAVEIEGGVLTRELGRYGTYFVVFAPKITRRAHDRNTWR